MPPNVTRLTRYRLKTMTDQATILRRVEAPDGAGGRQVSWTAVATDVACSVRAGAFRPREALFAERLSAINPWFVDLPVGSDVMATDRIEVNGHTLEVTAAMPRTWQTCLTVLCTEL